MYTVLVLGFLALGGLAIAARSRPAQRETGRHHVRPGRRPDQRSGRPVAGPTRRRPGHIADTVRFVPVDELPVERTDVVVDDVRLVRPYVARLGLGEEAIR